MIACPCILFEGRLYLRVSAQIYNAAGDYVRARGGVLHFRRPGDPYAPTAKLIDQTLRYLS